MLQDRPEPAGSVPTDESPRAAPPLRVSVDLNRCQAYAQCCYAAPGHFVLQGREALYYDPAPSAADRLVVERARIACPVQAIHVESPGTDRR